MALDILPIQALSIPCESSFSSVAEIFTRRRRPVGPTLVEAIQLLKSWNRDQRLDFTSPWKTLQGSTGPLIADADLLAELQTDDHITQDFVIAALAAEEGNLDDWTEIDAEVASL